MHISGKGVFHDINGASQQRDCPGFTPDSLLIQMMETCIRNQNWDKDNKKLSGVFANLIVFVIFVPVLVSPLPVLLEMSDEKGNQVQILNRPAAVSPSKIFEYSTSHCPPGGWEGIQRGISQKTCQDNIVLVLSGNKATKH